ncbi:MAG: peptide ABC transporter substrate-binding protein, partial [Chloroflexaceae bacterium]|nr:peptide ABC transporter substrate-binding protein [Chloroflexaceae bacterium]
MTRYLFASGTFRTKVPPVLRVALCVCCLWLFTGCGLLGVEQNAAPPSTTAAPVAQATTAPAAPTAAPTAPAEQPTGEVASDPASFPTSAPPATPEGPGGNLIMALSAQDPTTLDPALIGDVLSAFVARQLFSGLVRLDDTLTVQSDLAERWQLSDDGRTYTFVLRENARFADGTPITSEDVRYSLERATDPALATRLPAATYLSDIVGVREKLSGAASSISGVQVLDERTIALTIDQPKSFFLSKLAHPTSYVIDRQTVERGGPSWYTQPNGSGPFTIERWDSNEVMILQRNPNFYRDLAELDRITFLLGANASNALVQYEEGRVDVAEVPSFALDRVQDESNPLSQELVMVPQLSLTYIGMNVEQPPFDDPYVRQAFTLLLDRQKIADVSLYGSVVPAYGILPPGIPGYNPELPTLAADLARFEALLEESRYGSAENLPPIVAYGGGWTTTLREIAAEFGVEIEVRVYENFGTFLAELDEGTFPMYSSGWIADY